MMLKEKLDNFQGKNLLYEHVLTCGLQCEHFRKFEYIFIYYIFSFHWI